MRAARARAGSGNAPAWRRMLSLIAAQAGNLTANGQMPARSFDDVSRAVASCAPLLGDTAPGFIVTTLFESTDLIQPIFKLLAWAARALALPPASGTRSQQNVVRGAFTTSMRIVTVLAGSPHLGPFDGPPFDAEAWVLRHIADTELLVHLSRLLVAPPPTAACSTRATAGEARVKGAVLVGAFMTAVVELAMQEGMHAARVRRALLRSCILDSLVRAMVSAGQSEGHAGSRQHYVERSKLQFALVHITRVLSLPGANASPECVAWSQDVVASPGMQHFVLLHAVSQLQYMDSGCAFGLAASDALPAARVSHPSGTHSLTPCAYADPSQPLEAVQHFPLGGETIVHGFDSFGLQLERNPAFRPSGISHRALRTLCVRLAAAGCASWEAEAVEAAGSSSGGASGSVRREGASGSVRRGGASGGGRGPLRRFGGVDGVAVALSTLQCALVTLRGDARHTERSSLWADIVRTCNSVMQMMKENEWAAGALGAYLLGVLRPVLPPIQPELPLPSAPPPPLAAALSAGYVACADRMLRLVPRGMEANEGVIRALETFACYRSERGFDLVGLLAYGEPRAVASFITAGVHHFRGLTAECIRAAASGTVPLQQGALLAQQLDRISTRGMHLIDHLRTWLHECSAKVQNDSLVDNVVWWKRLGAGDVQQAASTSAAAASASAAAAAAAAPTRLVDLGGLRPEHRVFLLTAFALTRWVPSLARAAAALMACYLGSARSCEAGARAMRLECLRVAGRLLVAVLDWVPTLLEAGMFENDGFPTPYLPPSARTSEAPAAGSSSPGGSGWLEMLVDAPLSVQCLCGDLLRCWLDPALQGLNVPAEPVLHVLGYMARYRHGTVARFLNEPVAPGEPRTRYTALMGLRMSPDADGNRQAVWLLLTAITFGRNDVPGVEFPAPTKCDACAALVLPPPSVAEELLQVPTCSNPSCASLQGDGVSGAQLLRCGGSCGGRARYCQRDCQREHWKAGHKHVCGR